MGYNSQKYSKGRRNNRANAKDSTTNKNRIYPITEFGSEYVYIDTLFSKPFREIDKQLKRVFVTGPERTEVTLCYIDETVEMGCEFVGHLEEIYLKSLERVKIEDRGDGDGDKTLLTNTNPSTHHSWDYELKEAKGHEGFWLVLGEFKLYHRWGEQWTISGHSTSLFEPGMDGMDISRVAEMDEIEFARYFERLDWD